MLKDGSFLIHPNKSKLVCYDRVTSVKPNIKLYGKPIEVLSDDDDLGTKIYNDVKRKTVSELVCEFERSNNHIVQIAFLYVTVPA